MAEAATTPDRAVVEVVTQGNHMSNAGASQRQAWAAAADYVSEFLTKIGVRGHLKQIPISATRWMGDPEPRIKVSSVTTPSSVKIYVKPYGNDSAFEYNLVTSGGVLDGPTLRAAIFNEIGKQRSELRRSGVAFEEQAPQRPATMAEMVSSLEAEAGRAWERRKRRAEIDEELAEVEARYDRLVEEKDRLDCEAGTDAEAERAAERLEQVRRLLYGADNLN